jgi:hypothetical protein
VDSDSRQFRIAGLSPFDCAPTLGSTPEDAQRKIDELRDVHFWNARWGKQELIAIHCRGLRIQQGVKLERLTIVLQNLVQNPRLTALIEPLLAGTAKSVIPDQQRACLALLPESTTGFGFFRSPARTFLYPLLGK